MTEMAEQTWRKLGLVVPPKDADTWDQRPSAPCIIRTNDRYLMYFHREQYFSDINTLRRVGLAKASLDDPMTWAMVGDDPLIDLGPEGSIDSHWVSYPWVVPITDTHWHLYYAAWDGAFLETAPNQKRFTTCLAESDDGGMTWRRGQRPLLELGRRHAPDEHGTGSCAVVRVVDEYWMYYTALYKPNPGRGRISRALAVSTDGGHTLRAPRCRGSDKYPAQDRPRILHELEADDARRLEPLLKTNPALVHQILEHDGHSGPVR